MLLNKISFAVELTFLFAYFRMSFLLGSNMTRGYRQLAVVLSLRVDYEEQGLKLQMMTVKVMGIMMMQIPVVQERHRQRLMTVNIQRKERKKI